MPPPCVQVGGKPTPAWVNAKDLRFCTSRQCGTKVELGARCDVDSINAPDAVRCCDREDESGHPQATCQSPSSGAPTICMVSGGQCMPRLVSAKVCKDQPYLRQHECGFHSSLHSSAIGAQP